MRSDIKQAHRAALITVAEVQDSENVGLPYGRDNTGIQTWFSRAQTKHVLMIKIICQWYIEAQQSFLHG